MNSNVVLGQYYNANSWIHRLDPRTKIICVMLFMIGVFFIESIYILLGLFGFVFVLILFSKIPIGKFLKSISMIAYLLIFAFVCQVLFRKTGNLLVNIDFALTIYNLIISVILLALFFASRKIIKKNRFLVFILVLSLIMYLQYSFITGKKIVTYSIDIYDDSLTSSLFILLRIVLLLIMSSLLTLSTKPTDLNNGLEKLLKPLKIFKLNPAIGSMMISIALRNIPTLINEASRVLKAQASRGVDFKESKLKEKVMQIISLIVPMFIISYQRAEDLSDAMEARGYDPNKKRTSINVLKMRLLDYISMLVIFILFVLSIVMYIVF